jgi:hypothetical protein
VPEQAPPLVDVPLHVPEQLPPQLPEKDAEHPVSHVPLHVRASQLPVHSPEQLTAAWAVHAPLHVPLQAKLGASTSHCPLQVPLHPPTTSPPVQFALTSHCAFALHFAWQSASTLALASQSALNATEMVTPFDATSSWMWAPRTLQAPSAVVCDESSPRSRFISLHTKSHCASTLAAAV